MLFTIKACAQVSASSTIAADKKYSQQRSYCIALDTASSQVEKIFFPSDVGSEIMPEARIKPEATILKFKQVTLCPTWQSSLCLNPHPSRLWLIPTDRRRPPALGSCRSAGGCTRARRSLRTSVGEENVYRRRKTATLRTGKVRSSCTGASGLAQEDGKGQQRFGSVLVKGTRTLTVGNLWASSARMESSVHYFTCVNEKCDC